MNEAATSDDLTPEDDDLLKLLDVLQENNRKYERALAEWNDEYSDVIDDEIADAYFDRNYDEAAHRSSWRRRRAGAEPYPTRRPRRAMQRAKSEGAVLADDVSVTSSTTREDDYFDLTSSRGRVVARSPPPPPLSPSSSSVSEYAKISDDDDDEIGELGANLAAERARVTSRFVDVSHVITDVRRETEESARLRERVGMTHRSLTLLEMRQEKMMREALFENVTANNATRHLHDEVIQLRLREAQHQADIQRLMAENSRLKLRLMETRGNLKTTGKSPSNAMMTSLLPPPVKLNVAPARQQRAPSPGLMSLEDISPEGHPAGDHDGVVHRGTMRRFAATAPPSTIAPKPTRVERDCPLCGHRKHAGDDVIAVTSPRTRTRGTSTQEIENVVALRSTIRFLGIRIPIPLFVACLLRVLDDSLLVVGHICFGEFPGFDFPELRDRALCVLGALRDTIHASRDRS